MNLNQFAKPFRFQFYTPVFSAIFAVCLCPDASAADPLPSWNEGPAKKAILEVVAGVTNESD